MSYIIPSNELSLSQIQDFKAAAIEAGIQTAMRAGIGQRSQLVVRHGFPNQDFGQPAGQGWLADNYVNPVIAAAGWGSAFSAGAVPLFVPTLQRTKVAVFYKFAATTPATVVRGVRFRVGNTGASTRGTFYLQLETQSKLEPDVYFSEPVVYEPEDPVYIEILYSAGVAVGAEQIPFGSFIVARVGANIS